MIIIFVDFSKNGKNVYIEMCLLLIELRKDIILSSAVIILKFNLLEND